MVDISIVNGIINQLITWGAPPCIKSWHRHSNVPFFGPDSVCWVAKPFGPPVLNSAGDEVYRPSPSHGRDDEVGSWFRWLQIISRKSTTYLHVYIYIYIKYYSISTIFVISGKSDIPVWFSSGPSRSPRSPRAPGCQNYQSGHQEGILPPSQRFMVNVW